MFEAECYNVDYLAIVKTESESNKQYIGANEGPCYSAAFLLTGEKKKKGWEKKIFLYDVRDV